MKRNNVGNISSTDYHAAPEFLAAANLILDAIEDAFVLRRRKGRDECVKAIVNTLDYYTIPRDLRLLPSEISAAALESGAAVEDVGRQTDSAEQPIQCGTFSQKAITALESARRGGAK